MSIVCETDKLFCNRKFLCDQIIMFIIKLILFFEPQLSNGQILQYCHFNKVIKGPGTSLKSPALNQKHVRNVCHTAH